MKNLSEILLEKLKINKDTKINDLYQIPKESLDFIKSLFSSRGDYDQGAEFRKTYRLKNPNKILDIWTDLMIGTNSIPFVYKNQLVSVPGNFGKNIWERGNVLGLKKEDFLNAYDSKKDGAFHEINQHWEDFMKLCINNLLNYRFKGDYTFDIDYFIDPDDYSDKAKEILSTHIGIYAIPFILHIKNKNGKYIDLKCEIVCDSYRYYNYNIEGENTISSADFLEKVFKRL